MGANFFWRLKAKLTRRSFADSLVNADAMAYTDELISEKILKYNSDEEQIDSFRKNHASTILQFRKSLENSDKRKLAESGIKTNVKQYVSELRQQLYEIQKIIKLSSNIVANEHLSILYDIRRPMMILTTYKNTLSSSLKNAAVDDKSRQEITSMMNAIQDEYEIILKYTIDLCGQMEKAGVEQTRDPSGLAKVLANRTRIKKMLGARHLVLVNNISNIQKFFRELKKNKMLSDDEANKILRNIYTFKDNFTQLSEISKARIDGAEMLIKECVLLQKRKFEELNNLKQEVQKLVTEQDELRRAGSILGKDTEAALQNCRTIIEAIEREDTRLISDERSEERLTISGLVSDDSRLHSEGPVTTEPKTNTILGKMRSHAKAFSFILLGTFAVNMGVSVATAVTYDKSQGDKILVIGSPELIEHYMQKEGKNISLSEIESETRVIIDVEKIYVLDSIKSPQFVFSRNFDNTEGMIDSASLEKQLQIQIEKSLNDSISAAKNKLYAQLKHTNLSQREKDKIFEESIVAETVFLPEKSSVTGYTDPNGSVIGCTPNSNNNILSEKRGKNALLEVAKVLLEIQKTSEFHINQDSVSKIPVIPAGAIYKHSKLHLVINDLNKWVKSADANLMNRFFSFPENAKYTEFNSKDTLQIDYQKYTQKNETELLKFDLAARLMKSINPTRYQKLVIDGLQELRKAEIKLTFKTTIKVYGSGKTLLLAPLAPADLPVREEAAMAQKQEHYETIKQKQHYVPSTIGETSSKAFVARGKSGRTESSNGFRYGGQQGKQHKVRMNRG